MNKQIWLETLENHLKKFDEDEKKEILADYEEYFYDAGEAGKTEVEIIEALGSPKKIAKSLKVDASVKACEENRTFKNIFKAGLAIASLSLVNLIVFGIPMLFVGTIVMLFSIIGVALFGIGLSIIVGSFVEVNIILLPAELDAIVRVLLGLSTSSFGGLVFLMNYFIAKSLVSLFIRYFKFNVAILKKERD